VRHFRVFGSKCYIKREDGKMGKFDSRVDKGILVGYSSIRKAYKCYNLRLKKVVESINVTIDETGRAESKEEENKSMEQLFEKEAEDEVEEEDEENLTETEEQVQQVSSNTPSKRVQKIILQIRLLEAKMQELRLEEKFVHQNKHTYHSYLQLNQTFFKKPTRMNFGIRPWIKNLIK
jgi:hypothetical protein